MVLTLALSYGGRESLVRAARRLAEQVAAGALAPTAISEAILNAALPTHDLPPVDLLIRTSGEQRISNFLLWELAYAELMFVDTPWPEFRRAQLDACLDGFGHRERRFGQTSAQVRSDVGTSA
jgi:undecaprenyl diphosphate synthase